MKAGCYEGCECTPFLTGGEEREASTAEELKRAPEQGIIQLPTGGTVNCHIYGYVILAGV